MAALPTVGASSDTWGTELNTFLEVAHNSGGGLRLPRIVVVGGSGSGVVGDYTCDGTADDVQVQAAVDDVLAGDADRVLLVGPTFNFAAPVDADGTDDVDVELDCFIHGMGMKSTTITLASGIAAGFRFRDCIRGGISDLGFVVDDSIAIQTVAGSVTGGYRSLWLGTIRNIQVKGPFDGTDSDYAFDLDNVFRTVIENIEINGVTNGIRFYNSNSAFNAGDLTVLRTFVDLGNGGNNGVAYHFESAAGNMNQIFLATCHSIANASSTGTVAWKFSGAGNTSHIRAHNINVEQFAKTAEIASTASDVRLDFVHVTQRNGSTFADVDGYDNGISCGLVYVEPAATVTVIDDDNTYTAKPNVYGPISGYVDTGGTVTVELDDCAVLRDSVWDGDTATIAAGLKKPPGVAQQRIVTLTDAATVATDASLGDVFRVVLGGNRTLGAPTNATDGQHARWEVAATGSTRTLTLATGAGAFALATGATLASSGSIAVGSFITVDAVYQATANRWRVLNTTIHTV